MDNWWQLLMERLPSKTVLFCSALSALIPWAVSRFNSKLHEWGDPPWKKGNGGS